jgi:hypothetical protein
MAWAFTAYAYKFLVAVLMTPVIYGIHALVEYYLGRSTAEQMKRSAMRG